MNALLERNCYDPRRQELGRLAVTVLILLGGSALWHTMRGDLLYRVACGSIGYSGREDLLVAALSRHNPTFSDEAQYWRYSLARPDWIAWSSVREKVPLGNGSWLPKWEVTVADHDLTVKGVIAVDRLALPPADSDGDGLCEVVKEVYPPRTSSIRDGRWWVVLRLREEQNEIVSIGLSDLRAWHARRVRLKPIWRDENGDGKDELVFITVETTRLPDGGFVFKPPKTVAVFEWDRPGGMLVPQSVSEDSGIIAWTPDRGKPMLVAQDADLDPLVRSILPWTDENRDGEAGR